jgi:hypothetical protein
VGGEQRGDMGSGSGARRGPPIRFSPCMITTIFSVFHFKTAADAEVFHARFGGDRLPIVEPHGRRRGAGRVNISSDN